MMLATTPAVPRRENDAHEKVSIRNLQFYYGDARALKDISLPLYRRIEKNAQLMDFKCVEFVEELLYGQYRKKPLTK